MCVLPSLIPVSCTRWANIERPIFRRFRPGLVAGWVKDMSKLCLAAVLVAIYGHNTTLAVQNDFALCLSRADVQVIFLDADTRSPFCGNKASIVVILKGHLIRRTEDRNESWVDAHWQP